MFTFIDIYQRHSSSCLTSTPLPTDTHTHTHTHTTLSLWPDTSSLASACMCVCVCLCVCHRDHRKCAPLSTRGCKTRMCSGVCPSVRVCVCFLKPVRFSNVSSWLQSICRFYFYFFSGGGAFLSESTHVDLMWPPPQTSPLHYLLLI